MNYKNVVITVEAILFGGPMTFIALLMLPIFLLAPFVSNDTSLFDSLPLFALSVGALLALAEYWRLAYVIVFGMRYKFGLLFWAAVAGSLGGTYLAQQLLLFNSPVMQMFLGSIILTTIHFVYLQARRGEAGR